MANEIRILSSLTALKEVDVTEGGNTYDLSVVDDNANKIFSGDYSSLTYTDDAIASWRDAIVSATSYGGLNDSGWTDSDDVTNGTIPTTVKAFSVEYIAELGTVGNVSIQLTFGQESVVIAVLDLGEGICIPIQAGIVPANIKIKADVYSSNVNEAAVNILLVGV